MPTSHTSDDNTQLDAFIAEYLEAVERGHKPDREQFLKDHPEFASQLRAFFADLDNMNAAKGSVRPELDVTFVPAQDSKSGTILVGRYKLLENIGEGGMGSVWVAEQQQPVKRKVAIKLVKAGMDSKQVLARFEAERQALALMDHPNIAKVFDGGMTDTGRPFFVMEYVKGVPFTEYCDRARLSLKERLNLFIPVCQAVQHAHQKGIIHRDLKPSNILVCLYDGKPVPKVIDFGLAKAMHQPLTEQSIYSGHGVVLGTPLYMSPEQADNDNVDIDTRADVYALGVVLYELLTGTTPLDRMQLKNAAMKEILRLIKEVDPPRPSTRLSGNPSLASIAALRKVEPRYLQRSLSGDLDWIVMKALEKERTRRYETAIGLAKDVERYLNEEPVEASPPSRFYRIKKFVQKHRFGVAAAMAVLTAILVGSAGAGWGWSVAVDALSSESMQRQKAERELVAGIIRPLGYQEELSEVETQSLIAWAQLEDSNLKVKALAIALDDPNTAWRMRLYPDRVIQACVGLSLDRRKKVLDLVGRAQRNQKADPRIRMASCHLAIALGSDDLPAFQETLATLEAGETGNHRALCQFAHVAHQHLSGQQFTSLQQQLVEALIRSLDAENDGQVVASVSKELLKFESCISPELGTHAWHGLADACDRIDYFFDEDIVRAMAMIARKLPSETLDELVPSVTNAITNSSEIVHAGALTKFLAIVPQLDTDKLIPGCAAMLNLWESGADYALERSVLALGPYWVRAHQERIIEFSRVRLQESSVRDSLGNARDCSDVLRSVIPHLDAELALRLWESLPDDLFVCYDYSPRGSVITKLVARLASADNDVNLDQLLLKLRTLIVQNPSNARQLFEFMEIIDRQLSPSRAAQAWHEARTLTRDGNGSELLDLTPARLKGLAALLPDSDVKLQWDTLRMEIEGDSSGHLAGLYINVMDVLAERIPESEAEKCWNAVKNMTNGGESFRLRQLSAFAARLTGKSARAEFEALIHLAGSSSANSYVALVCLSRLSTNLTPEQNQMCVELILRRIPDETLGVVAEFLGEFVPNLPEEMRDKSCSEAIRILLTFSEYYRNRMPGGINDNYEIESSVAVAMNDPETVATVLSHPLCVRRVQEILLLRLEEIAFHDGKHLLLSKPVATDRQPRDPWDFNSPWSDVFNFSRLQGNAPQKPNPQFSTLQDASRWIEVNCPAFDLDAVCPVEVSGVDFSFSGHTDDLILGRSL